MILKIDGGKVDTDTVKRRHQWKKGFNLLIWVKSSLHLHWYESRTIIKQRARLAKWNTKRTNMVHRSWIRDANSVMQTLDGKSMDAVQGPFYSIYWQTERWARLYLATQNCRSRSCFRPGVLQKDNQEWNRRQMETSIRHRNDRNFGWN